MSNYEEKCLFLCKYMQGESDISELTIESSDDDLGNEVDKMDRDDRLKRAIDRGKEFDARWWFRDADIRNYARQLWINDDHKEFSLLLTNIEEDSYKDLVNDLCIRLYDESRMINIC